MAQRAGGVCEYCRSPERLAGYAYEVEHIVPLARGGVDTMENLALACGLCNKAKGVRQRAQDPDTGELATLYNPRENRWETHFAWSEGYTVINGLTPAGRATVAALRLNTIRRQDARVLWRGLTALELGDPPFRWP
ncbi:MAG: HNH endonuclease [Chloroflexota bacterium]